MAFLHWVMAALFSRRQGDQRELPSAPVGAPSDPGVVLERDDAPVVDLPSGYTYVRSLREGGLGTVMVVRELSTGREVALKRLRRALRGDEHCTGLIEAEARITASLQHPNIVPVYDVGVNAEGNFFYTMRLVPGRTLGEYLDSLTQQRTSLPSVSDRRKLVGCLRKVCDAVMYAHDRGVLHLDLKPSNILVGDFGGVLLLDWGCAAQLAVEGDDQPGTEGSASRPDGTLRHIPRGTPQYMAPEQFEGQPQEIGPQADVYQLGGLLFEILTMAPPEVWWRRPGSDDRPTKLRPQLDVSPTVRRGRRSVGGPLAAICQKALSFDAGRRYASVRELALDIDRWFAMAPVSAYRENLPARFMRFVRGHPTFSSAAAASVALIILFNLQLLRVTMQGYGDTLASLVAGQGRASVGGVSALQGLFETRGAPMAQDEFVALAGFYHESFPGIHALEWVPRITGGERQVFVDSVRAAAAPDDSLLTSFQVRELKPGGQLGVAAARDEYFPVLYIVPFVGNEAALGFDLGSIDNRRSMLEAANARGNVSLSGPLDLVQAEATEVGILSAVPVRSSQEGSDSVQGYVTGVIKLSDLLRSSWSQIDIEHLSVRVYDVTDPVSPHLMWSNDGESNHPAIPVPTVDWGLFSASSELTVFDRRWSVWVQPRVTFLVYYPSAHFLEVLRRTLSG